MLRVVGARRVVRGHGRSDAFVSGIRTRPRTCATGRAARSGGTVHISASPPYVGEILRLLGTPAGTMTSRSGASAASATAGAIEVSLRR